MTSVITIPRQLAPIVGPATKKGVEFLEGLLSGIKKLAIGRITEKAGVTFIDNFDWGADTDSLEYNY